MSLEVEALVEFLIGTKASAASVPWWLLRPEDLRVIRAWAGEALPSAAQRPLLRALRSALRHSRRDEDRLTAGHVLVRGIRCPSVRAESRGLAQRQARLLLQLCRDATDPASRRDTATVSMMMLAGLRRQEVVALNRGDYDEEEGRLTIRSVRRGVRSVILLGECLCDLQGWLDQRGSFPGPLFTQIDTSGQATPAELSASAVNRLLARRWRDAGGLPATPRDLRAHFLCQIRRAGRRDERPPCRYYQDENGQPAWTLASLASA